jgi:glycosyltransferase involved in cell wall biosynthesis
MRMLHVLESFAPGGMETTFLNMLRRFRVEDDSIRHDVLSFAGGLLESSYRDAAHAVTIGADAATIDSRLAQHYDVVHILFERCAYRLLPQLLGRSSTPVIYGKGYDMGGMYRLNEGLRWQADESMLAACDGHTFTTPQLASGYEIEPGRTTVLRKAADVEPFQCVPDPDASTPLRVVCVANLHPRKRLGDLILALAQIADCVPEATLRLVGGGSAAEAERLRALAADHGLAERVSLAGVTTDVPSEIASSRIVVLPSSCEGVPTALLEGMAAGRPVVATNVGHVASIVDDGIEGFLVTPGDILTFAERLLRLLSDPELAARMASAARTRALAHDVRIVARVLLGTLREAAGGAA